MLFNYCIVIFFRDIAPSSDGIPGSGTYEKFSWMNQATELYALHVPKDAGHENIFEMRGRNSRPFTAFESSFHIERNS